MARSHDRLVTSGQRSAKATRCNQRELWLRRVAFFCCLKGDLDMENKVSSFATTADERIDQVRRAGITAALAAIDDRDLDQAGATMLASVFHQARLAGLGI